jgi:hypothetical protein
MVECAIALTRHLDNVWDDDVTILPWPVMLVSTRSAWLEWALLLILIAVVVTLACNGDARASNK